jgi:type VI secretion system protein VasD
MWCFDVLAIAARPLQRLLLCVACAALGGCAAAKVADDTLGNLTESLLEKTGIKAPDVPTASAVPQAEALRLPRKVSLRVHAGAQLNHDADRRPLSLVLRIYTLKSSSAFLQAPYEVFTSAAREKEYLGDDVLEAQELTLVPGQHYEAEERVPRAAAAVGVVALFNAPASQRWRFAFDAADAERSGIVLGAHGCALTVSQGLAIGAKVDTQRLGSTRCGP